MNYLTTHQDDENIDVIKFVTQTKQICTELTNTLKVKKNLIYLTYDPWHTVEKTKQAFMDYTKLAIECLNIVTHINELRKTLPGVENEKWTPEDQRGERSVKEHLDRLNKHRTSNQKLPDFSLP